MTSELRVPALRIRQGEATYIHQFGVDGKLLERFTSVSRIRRTSEQAVAGYQRPEALAHIASIRRYIETPGALLPNSLVIAFNQTVRFEPSADEVDGVCHGWLTIPIDDSCPAHLRPGFIVDGQQRAAAIRDARVERFPVAVTAFITDDEHEHRSQFILVNSVKPLSQSLIFELLPTTVGRLPERFREKRLATIVLECLNYQPGSALQGRIKTPTNPEGVAKDNSIIRMLINSVQDGALFRYRDPDSGLGDIDSMVQLVSNFWTAVELVFPGDWDLPPRRSRLLHGVGIVALGAVMDDIVRDLALEGVPTTAQFTSRLQPISPECHWSSGSWLMGQHGERAWNEIQNTTRDVQLLKDHLLALYRTAFPRESPAKRQRKIV